MTPEMFALLLPAFAVGVLVLSTHVLLGQQVLRRGIIFIDLAIAQVAALGTVWVHSFHEFEHLPFIHYWMPALFALAAAALIAWLEKVLPEELEAIIGCLYVFAAVMAMLLLANNPHGGELLKQVLSGQILWVEWSQLYWPTILSLILLCLCLWRPNLLHGKTFYIMFALMITLSVELIGVYLVFSSLILPALAVRHLPKASQYWIALILGVIAYALGLTWSTFADLPSGACIVVSLVILTVLVRLITSTQLVKHPLNNDVF